MTSLIEGREKEPIVMVAYGVPGVGKSTFATGAPNPVFIGPERNKSLNATKFPRTNSQAQLLGYLKEIEQGKHDAKQFRTVVLDTIDMHETVIHSEICAKEPGKTMETACKGYGKAYKESGRKLYEVRDALEAIINKKEMNVIILGHSIKVDFNDPMISTNYDTYEMCLHKGKKFDQNKIFIDWASTVLFLNWKTYASEDKSHAVSIGRREIRTEYRPSHLAKNRYNLPEMIEMLDDEAEIRAGRQPQTFNIILNHIENFYNSGAESNTSQNDFNILIHNIKQLMANVKDENLLPQVNAAINSSINNYDELKIIHDRINEIVKLQ